ncbi:MAG TPA: PorP/SprF family type IX secretion system membrane protein [Flavilitoribacter sp.]|nr:PorP/SprF family type IX secretion system membrane protein [Lewinella sp.]MCB9279161.1 PorP/SprF family type IX secretion system membrane protein [Lewinellaceae bacterium]HMQ63367.1 PorP/SprF family type IX secretion system membrane protein [Flavilitoribacter sp.]HMQ86720.1 PorP/SprF family type IX secretion system membrane protein [Flavilitoribacter sp.]
MNIRNTFYICALLLVINSLKAQDQHFTQFYASPLSLNPALAGSFQGKYRFSFIYRDQWRHALENPYTTYSAAADFRFQLGRLQKPGKDAFGAGMIFYSDKVSIPGFSTNQIMLSGAFHKSLSRRNDQFLSAGFQVGLAQRNVVYGSLTFDDQFNGSDGYTNPTAEELPENNFAYNDFHAGINYSYSPNRGIGFFAGAAIHHIMEPQTSFFYDEEKPDRYDKNYLFRKYTAHLSLQIPVGEVVKVSPRLLVYSQGPHFAVNAGSNIRIAVNQSGNTALHFGGWARTTRDEEQSPYLDAAIVMTGLEFNNFLFGVSYDLNLTALNLNRNGQGALEISIAYLGEYENDTVLCPKF